MLQEVQHKQAAIRLDRTLNHFAIASNVAIIRHEGQAALDTCRSYLEAWLRPVAEQTGEVRIHAEKRMTSKADVGKSRKTLTVSAFQRDKTRGAGHRNQRCIQDCAQGRAGVGRSRARPVTHPTG